MTGRLDTGTPAAKFWPRWAKAVAEGSPFPVTGGGGTGPVIPPVTAPLGAGATGGGTAGVALTFSGVSAGETVTVTGIAVDGSAVTDPVPVVTTAGDTAEQVAVAVAAAIDGLADALAQFTVGASATGGVVNLTNTSTPGTFDADPAVAVA